MEEAVDKKLFNGNRSKRKQWELDRRIVAYHEAGHAVATAVLGEAFSRVSIVGMTSGVGGVVYGTDKSSQFLTDEDFRNKITVAYAGHQAESIKFNQVTTGACKDITFATKMLKEYVQKYGFDESSGLLDMQVFQKEPFFNGSATMDRLRSLSLQMCKYARDLLEANWESVERLANLLLEQETVGSEEVLQILKDSTVECGAKEVS